MRCAVDRLSVEIFRIGQDSKTGVYMLVIVSVRSASSRSVQKLILTGLSAMDPSEKAKKPGLFLQTLAHVVCHPGADLHTSASLWLGIPGTRTNITFCFPFQRLVVCVSTRVARSPPDTCNAPPEEGAARQTVFPEREVGVRAGDLLRLRGDHVEKVKTSP
jgi:hypothetical protein